MVVEHPYDKKIEDIFRKVSIEVQISGMENPVIGMVHVDKGLRLSDHLNNNPTEYLILTDVQCQGSPQEVLFIKTAQIITIMPISEQP